MGHVGKWCFLFVGRQITSDVCVLILHLRCIMLTLLYVVVNSFTYTTTRSIRNENRLKSTKFVTLVCDFGILPPRFLIQMPKVRQYFHKDWSKNEQEKPP